MSTVGIPIAKKKKTDFTFHRNGLQEHKTAYKLTISMHHPTIRATLRFSAVTSFLARSLYESTTASPLFFFPNGTLYSKTLIYIICFPLMPLISLVMIRSHY